MSAEFLTALAAIEDIALFDTPADMQPFLTDWRKRHHGRALAVVSPGSTDAVAAVVALCNTHRVPIFRRAAIPAFVAARFLMRVETASWSACGG